ncbi:MAG: hypothetical protein ABIH66_03200 [bacterium]
MHAVQKTTPFKSYLFILVLLFFFSLLLAATPQKVNYQGYLKDNGIPVDTPTNFVVEQE